MKTKTGICLIMALLITVSSSAIGTVYAEECGQEGTENFGGELCWPFGQVEKKLQDATGGWVDEYTAELGEVVHFKMTFTYYKTNHENAMFAKNIIVVDTLPDCLGYDSAYPGPTSVDGKTITWDFGDLELYHEDFIVIYLNATVVAYTDQDGEDNYVQIDALEKCSNRDLRGSDTATVICEEPGCEPGIEVNKTVWNGEGWVDNYDEVYFKPGDIIKFQIKIVYEDCDDNYQLLNMFIEDYLPECLDYNEVYEVTTTGYAETPIVTFDGETITWSWVDTSQIRLVGGESLTLVFETIFTEYCCECPGENCAYVKAWGCQGPQYPYEGTDCASINCQPPETTFDKYIKDGEEWVKEIETYHGSTLEFKIELVYYGKYPCDNEPLTYIKFVDELPCILEYIEGSFESNLGENLTLELSDDGKILYFNASVDFELNLGETITITFEVDVVGCTECGCNCDYEAWNKAWVYGGCQQNFEMFDEVHIISYANCPPSTPQIRGATSGKVEQDLKFYVVSTDPDDNQMYYYLDMGDGNILKSDTTVNSGEEYEFTYAFGATGTYYLKAKAEDIHGAESEWTEEGYEHEVEITEGQPPLDSIEISVKKLSFGRAIATIKNNEETAYTDVEYKISMTGGILKRINVSDNGTIDEIAAGAKKQINTGPSILRGSVKLLNLGRVNGEIEVIAGGETYPYQFSGIVIGKLVLITKQSVPEE